LLQNCLAVLGNRDRVGRAELVASLRAEHKRPSRKYEDGITAEKMPIILKHFGVAPEIMRVKCKTQGKSTVRGYLRAEFLNAIPRNPVTQATDEISLALTALLEIS